MRDKTAFLALSAARVPFMFGKTSLASSYYYCHQSWNNAIAYIFCLYKIAYRRRCR